MNESYVIFLGKWLIHSGDKVRRGRKQVVFRRVVFDPEGDYVEVVDPAGKIHKCSPAELSAG